MLGDLGINACTVLGEAAGIATSGTVAAEPLSAPISNTCEAEPTMAAAAISTAEAHVAAASSLDAQLPDPSNTILSLDPNSSAQASTLTAVQLPATPATAKKRTHSFMLGIPRLQLPQDGQNPENPRTDVIAALKADVLAVARASAAAAAAASVAAAPNPYPAEAVAADAAGSPDDDLFPDSPSSLDCILSIFMASKAFPAGFSNQEKSKQPRQVSSAAATIAQEAEEQQQQAEQGEQHQQGVPVEIQPEAQDYEQQPVEEEQQQQQQQQQVCAETHQWNALPGSRQGQVISDPGAVSAAAGATATACTNANAGSLQGASDSLSTSQNNVPMQVDSGKATVVKSQSFTAMTQLPGLPKSQANVRFEAEDAKHSNMFQYPTQQEQHAADKHAGFHDVWTEQQQQPLQNIPLWQPLPAQQQQLPAAGVHLQPADDSQQKQEQYEYQQHEQYQYHKHPGLASHQGHQQEELRQYNSVPQQQNIQISNKSQQAPIRHASWDAATASAAASAMRAPAQGMEAAGRCKEPSREVSGRAGSGPLARTNSYTEWQVQQHQQQQQEQNWQRSLKAAEWQALHQQQQQQQPMHGTRSAVDLQQQYVHRTPSSGVSAQAIQQQQQQALSPAAPAAHAAPQQLLHQSSGGMDWQAMEQSPQQQQQQQGPNRNLGGAADAWPAPHHGSTQRGSSRDIEWQAQHALKQLHRSTSDTAYMDWQAQRQQNTSNKGLPAQQPQQYDGGQGYHHPQQQLGGSAGQQDMLPQRYRERLINSKPLLQGYMGGQQQQAALMRCTSDIGTYHRNISPGHRFEPNPAGSPPFSPPQAQAVGKFSEGKLKDILPPPTPPVAHGRVIGDSRHPMSQQAGLASGSPNNPMVVQGRVVGDSRCDLSDRTAAEASGQAVHAPGYSALCGSAGPDYHQYQQQQQGAAARQQLQQKMAGAAAAGMRPGTASDRSEGMAESAAYAAAAAAAAVAASGQPPGKVYSASGMPWPSQPHHLSRQLHAGSATSEWAYMPGSRPGSRVKGRSSSRGRGRPCAFGVPGVSAPPHMLTGRTCGGRMVADQPSYAYQQQSPKYYSGQPVAAHNVPPQHTPATSEAAVPRRRTISNNIAYVPPVPVEAIPPAATSCVGAEQSAGVAQQEVEQYNQPRSAYSPHTGMGYQQQQQWQNSQQYKGHPSEQPMTAVAGLPHPTALGPPASTSAAATAAALELLKQLEGDTAVHPSEALMSHHHGNAALEPRSVAFRGRPMWQGRPLGVVPGSVLPGSMSQHAGVKHEAAGLCGGMYDIPASSNVHHTAAQPTHSHHASFPSDQPWELAQLPDGHAMPAWHDLPPPGSHTFPPWQQQHHARHASYDGSTGAILPQSARRQRENLPKGAVAYLKRWLYSHVTHPYPTEPEKMLLAQETGLDLLQLNNWFINSRVRIWKPLVALAFELHASNLEQRAQASNDLGMLHKLAEAKRSPSQQLAILLSDGETCGALEDMARQAIQEMDAAAAAEAERQQQSRSGQH